ASRTMVAMMMRRSGTAAAILAHSGNRAGRVKITTTALSKAASEGRMTRMGSPRLWLYWLRAPCHARGESLRSRLGLEEGSRNTGSPDSERKREQQHAVKASKK